MIRTDKVIDFCCGTPTDPHLMLPSCMYLFKFWVHRLLRELRFETDLLKTVKYGCFWIWVNQLINYSKLQGQLDKLENYPINTLGLVNCFGV